MKQLPDTKAIIGTLLVFLIMMSLYGCDVAKFTGYNYQADEIKRSIPITGRILNIFTRELVPDATINVAGQQTVSDSNGSYNLDYFINGQEQLNGDFETTISAAKFFPLDTSIIITPADNRQDFLLIYAAPIVLSSSRDGLGNINALVFDYQGFDNVKEAEVTGFYYDGARRREFSATFPLTIGPMIDANTVRINGTLPDSATTSDFSGNRISDRYAITVRDFDGYEDFFIFDN